MAFDKISRATKQPSSAPRTIGATPLELSSPLACLCHASTGLYASLYVRVSIWDSSSTLMVTNPVRSIALCTSPESTVPVRSGSSAYLPCVGISDYTRAPAIWALLQRQARACRPMQRMLNFNSSIYSSCLRVEVAKNKNVAMCIHSLSCIDIRLQHYPSQHLHSPAGTMVGRRYHCRIPDHSSQSFPKHCIRDTSNRHAVLTRSCSAM